MTAKNILVISSSVRKFLQKHHFLRNVGLLAGATLLSQALGVIAAPVLTRLYNPQEFGSYAIFLSIISLVLVVASLRYELAIPMASDDQRGLDVLHLTLVLSCLTSILFLTVVLIFYRELCSVFSWKGSCSILLLLPLGLLIAASYQAFSFWSVRKGCFKSLALSKICQSGSQTFTQLALGCTKIGLIGLIFGDLLGKAIGVLTLKKGLLLPKADRASSLGSVLGVSERYRKFAVLSSPSALINQGSFQVPSILLAYLYGTEVVGFYALVQRIFAIPTDLLAQSVSKVYYREAVRVASHGDSRLTRLLVTTAKRLLLVSLTPAIFIALLSPVVFTYIFGDEWTEAGFYAQILTLPFVFRMATGPVSQTLNIIERQGLQLLLEISRFVLVTSSIIFPGLLKYGPRVSLVCYSIAIIISQSLAFCLYYLATRNRGRD